MPTQHFLSSIPKSTNTSCVHYYIHTLRQFLILVSCVLKLMYSEKSEICFRFKNESLFLCSFCKLVDRNKYKTNLNSFCYVCGKYTLPSRRLN